jgi:N-acetylglucosaminyldiphosphoundecaprenol N-acetyl-beta-D-mannosaminyltransferase
MDKSATVQLFGMTIDAVGLHGAVDRVLQWCEHRPGECCRYVVTPNVDHAVLFQEHESLRAAYRNASLVLADGAPVVLASRLLGRALPGRVAGSDLAPAVLRRSAQWAAEHGRPLRVFLLGAGPGVGERAKQNIQAAYPGVEIAGTLSPPMGFERDDQENERILKAISESQSDVVFIGLGAPKQELWTYRFAERIDAKAALCIGATIDFLAGDKRRAPQWMQRIGLEWLHRLASEPKRLAMRYLKDAWVFPQLVWREWRQV